MQEEEEEEEEELPEALQAFPRLLQEEEGRRKTARTERPRALAASAVELIVFCFKPAPWHFALLLGILHVTTYWSHWSLFLDLTAVNQPTLVWVDGGELERAVAEVLGADVLSEDVGGWEHLVGTVGQERNVSKILMLLTAMMLLAFTDCFQMAIMAFNTVQAFALCGVLAIITSLLDLRLTGVNGNGTLELHFCMTRARLTCAAVLLTATILGVYMTNNHGPQMLRRRRRGSNGGEAPNWRGRRP